MNSTATGVASDFAWLPSATILILLIFLSYAYIHRWALPKPLPGIPYNKEALSSILGDGAELSRIRRSGGQARAWFFGQNRKHNSPIVQVFLGPLKKPAIIIADFRETQDILTRRGKEFDRGSRQLETFHGIMPWHHIAMKTDDPQFKANRELVKDLMTPHFLNEVSGPAIYENSIKFIHLWKLKSQLSHGRPFCAEGDITSMAFDTIKAVALGNGQSESMTMVHSSTVKAYSKKIPIHESRPDKPVLFPQNIPSVDLYASQVQQEAIASVASLPFPKLFHQINNRRSHMRNAFGAKFAMLREQVSIAVERLTVGGKIQTALDYMIQREKAIAQKANKQPDFNSPFIYDELYGFIIAGHETTSTSFQWAVKHLANDQRVQKKLRDELRAFYSAAATEKRQLTFEEVIKSQIPYLSAVIEELLRVSPPVKAVFREALVDTTILGHYIPKGTEIFMIFTGPSISETSFEVTEALRTESARSNRNARGWSWDGKNPQDFLPERWMRTEEGRETFDPLSGPMLSFSAGTRGCFGRRLAYLQLKIILTMLVWNFEFEPLAQDLNSFDTNEGLTIKPAKCFVKLAETK